MFDSNRPVRQQPARYGYEEETFYTDPNKASEDLKALLEGGMDGDDDEGVEGVEGAGDAGDDGKREAGADKTSQGAGPSKPPGSSKIIPDDGVVDGLNVQLLPHQVEGVNWMRGRELGPVKRGKVPKGGLLADDMGLGKTLQSISLILINPKPEKGDKAWKKQFEGIQKTTLVVAPLALIRQWEVEIKDKVLKTHGLKVCVHHGPQRTKSFQDLQKYDVVITTYQILVSEHGQSAPGDAGLKVGCFGMHWWRVILDEAHTIKNRNAKATKACYALSSEYRWCLSGTPMQNNLDELQSLVKFLRVKPLEDLKQWKEQIDQPMKAGKGHIAIRRLHTLLRCFMKRRTKEILKEDGALNPGGKPSAEGQKSATGFRHTNRKVVTVAAEMDEAERKFYEALEYRADKSMANMMRSQISYANAFTLLLRLRQACNHPKLLEKKLGADMDDLLTGYTRKSSKEADVDDVTELFSGMGINSEDEDEDEEIAHKGRRPRHRVVALDSDDEEEEDAQSAAKTSTKASRRPRNRNAVIDSDDEESEGSWIVPENERSNLNLGKAGGSEDENAEGGGESIGSDDSEDDDSEDDEEEGETVDRSNLDSFIVDDDDGEEADGTRPPGEEVSDDDDFAHSLHHITQKMAAQTLKDKRRGNRKGGRKSVKGRELSQPIVIDSDSDGSPGKPRSDSGSDSDSGSGSGSGSGFGDEDADSDDSDSDGGYDPYRIPASAKIREMKRLLQAEAREHKFIVFSQFTSMLDLIEPFLREMRLSFVRYDGSMRNDEREESLRSLREDKRTRVLLCSLKCGSLGLNLTAATRVIIVEPFWNPFVEEQAIDRVHRLTQTVDVVVYKLTVKDTVEEGILDLQDKKRLLAEQTIEGGSKKSAVKLGLNEIIELFKPLGGAGRGRPARGAEDPAALDDGGALARDTAFLMKRTRVMAKQGREESSIYGRRW
ncbi:putative ATP-dependent helicase [Escovopsis weberi]|uniref:Putative ATP-dependent helicase n=1 Tax=Escovopsis weberi TaxID=150374 RepID=A0A0M8MQU2_ESCWE|nr:putative ATP-dependent helicase [Escovopsis weberi]